jgi:hypothetical protein
MALIGVGDGPTGALCDRGCGQELGHRRLAGAVAADQSDAHALADSEGGSRDEPSGADAHREVLDVDHVRHRTGAADRSPAPSRR